ncbi:MAG: CDP-glycerol--glycerophosphate glycerophosphotransferase [Bacillales bacterium]|jgi:CDP-glycerol glycerophosphotransferase (TagB/SpsB family)|nr:CDP-glycerol--glycerophosphate glycerophosphotransferase [Bacillales bacterium]
MLRNFMIFVYKLYFQMLFYLFSLLPINQKICFIASFGDNVQFLLEELSTRDLDTEVIVLKSRQCNISFYKYGFAKCYPFETFNLFGEARNIYHIATSKTILLDNYFGFLSFVRFRRGVECIQLWHAAGAIKKFGLLDPSNASRSATDLERFKRVYRNFHKVVVGSEANALVYFKTFGLSDSNVLRTGVPRSDIFYDEVKRGKVEVDVKSVLGLDETKKVILYAPTFRFRKFSMNRCALDIQLLKENFSSTHVVLLKAHRNFIFADNNVFENDSFCRLVNDEFHVNELLLVTDLLITDYTSIPFEYSILERPMIFFAYDLEDYCENSGVLFDYKQIVPGPVAYTTSDVVNIILEESFDFQRLRDFRDEWNKYMDGNSSRNTVDYILNR